MPPLFCILIDPLLILKKRARKIWIHHNFEFQLFSIPNYFANKPPSINKLPNPNAISLQSIDHPAAVGCTNYHQPLSNPCETDYRIAVSQEKRPIRKKTYQYTGNRAPAGPEEEGKNSPRHAIHVLQLSSSSLPVLLRPRGLYAYTPRRSAETREVQGRSRRAKVCARFASRASSRNRARLRMKSLGCVLCASVYILYGIVAFYFFLL